MVPQEAMQAAAKDWRPVGRTGPKEEKWHAAIARNGQMKKLSFSRKFVNEIKSNNYEEETSKQSFYHWTNHLLSSTSATCLSQLVLLYEKTELIQIDVS